MDEREGSRERGKAEEVKERKRMERRGIEGSEDEGWRQECCDLFGRV